MIYVQVQCLVVYAHRWCCCWNYYGINTVIVDVFVNYVINQTFKPALAKLD